MTDLETIKLYYYDGSWNQVTGISKFPLISKRMNATSVCTIELHDFEGGLYSTWINRDFTQMKVEDGDANILFQGYLENKKYNQNGLILTITGFASKLNWTPFNKSFILAEGLVKTTPYAGTGLPTNYAIAETTAPIGICSDGTYYYITTFNEAKVYKYSSSFAHQSTTALTNNTFGLGICWDGTYFYCVDINVGDGNSYIRKYNSAFVYQSSSGAVTDGDATGITFMHPYLYIIDATAKTLYVYDTSFNFVDSSELSEMTTPAEIENNGNYFFITDYTNERVYVYDRNLNYITYFSVSETDTPFGIVFDGSYLLIVSNGDEKVYVYGQSGGIFSEDNTIELQNSDHSTVSWTANQWVYDRNVGLLIKENTQGDVTVTWDIDSVTPHNNSEAWGDVGGLDEAFDNDTYTVLDTGSTTPDAYVDVDVIAGGGESISDAYNLRKIIIDYRFGTAIAHVWAATAGKMLVKMQINKGGSWVDLKDSNGATVQVYLFSNDLFNWNTGIVWVGFGSGESYESIIIEEDLEDYFDKTGNDYTSLKGIRFVMEDCNVVATDTVSINLDYLSVQVIYNAKDISPVLTAIEDNGTTWIYSSATDFNASAIQAGDVFQIADNTEFVLSNISSVSTIPIYMKSSWTKFMPREFRGANCMEALQAVCDLEQWEWAEDHENRQIVVVAIADLEDSGITVDSSDYERDWEYEDKCNAYAGVIVYGNGKLGIIARAEYTSSTSLIWKQITNDNILSYTDAKKIADSELAKLQSKRPSVKITLYDSDGTYSVLETMKTINITLARPTVAAADYPIRRLDIERIGEIIKYTSYCGMGSTPDEERIANDIQKLKFQVHKVASDNLTNSGLNYYIQNNTTLLSWLAIGAANALEQYLPYEYSRYNDYIVESNMGYWVNNSGQDDRFFYTIPLSPLRGSKKLYIKSIQVGVGDADSTDYLNNVNIIVTDGHLHADFSVLWSDASPPVQQAVGEYDSGTIDQDVSGYITYKIRLDTVHTTQAELDITYVKIWYYYDD